MTTERKFPQQVKHDDTGLIANVLQDSGAIELEVENPGNTDLPKGKILGVPTHGDRIRFDETTGWFPIKD